MLNDPAKNCDLAQRTRLKHMENTFETFAAYDMVILMVAYNRFNERAQNLPRCEAMMQNQAEMCHIFILVCDATVDTMRYLCQKLSHLSNYAFWITVDKELNTDLLVQVYIMIYSGARVNIIGCL